MKIHCDSIHPGGFKKLMLADMERDIGGNTGTGRKVRGSVAIVEVEPESVANTVVYVGSDQSDSVNDTELVIDGGVLIL